MEIKLVRQGSQRQRSERQLRQQQKSSKSPTPNTSQRQQQPSSPNSFRLNRNKSKQIQPSISNLQQISSTNTQIHSLIDQLDFKLKVNYHLKENNLIQAYRQQLIKAHKDLVELKNNNNEQQIKNQMNQKFLQLKKQRLQLIQVNMFYSNKCLEYKKELDKKLTEGHQLEREIEFLEKQINNSNSKKVELLSQIYQHNSPIKTNKKEQLQTQRNLISIPSQTPNKKASLSTHANTQVMKKLSMTSNSKSKLYQSKMPELNNQVQKLFEQKLSLQENSITDRSLTSINRPTILAKLSNLKTTNQKNIGQNLETKRSQNNVQNKRSQIQELFLNTVEEFKEKRGIKKQIPLFKGEEFSDIEKKQIMKAFLSKQSVKQYIYNIIFDKADDSTLFRKKNSNKQKIRIIASQTKIQANNLQTQ